MNILLDTHALIWALEDNPRLSAKAREAIIDGANTVFVSSISVWEINIKKALGKLHTPDDLLDEIIAHRFTPLDVNFEHADLAGKLPDIHKDPFDRMLIAQAMSEKLTFVTRDEIIPQYGLTCLW